MLNRRVTIRCDEAFEDALRARATRENRKPADLARLILAEGLGLTADSIPAALPASEPSETPFGDHPSDQDDQSAQKKNVPPTGEDTGRVEAPHPAGDADADSAAKGSLDQAHQEGPALGGEAGMHEAAVLGFCGVEFVDHSSRCRCERAAGHDGAHAGSAVPWEPRPSVKQAGDEVFDALNAGCGLEVRLEGAMGPLAFACELPRGHEGVCAVRGLHAGDSASPLVESAPCAPECGWEGDLCGRLMLGSGPDSYDPVCELAEGHDGACMSTAAIDQHRLAGPVCPNCGKGRYVEKSPGGTESWSCGRVVGK